MMRDTEPFGPRFPALRTDCPRFEPTVACLYLPPPPARLALFDGRPNAFDAALAQVGAGTGIQPDGGCKPKRPPIDRHVPVALQRQRRIAQQTARPRHTRKTVLSHAAGVTCPIELQPERIGRIAHGHRCPGSATTHC